MNTIKKSRAASFIAVTLIYMAASAVGILTYRLLPFSFWLSLLIADMAATVFTFLFSLIFQNASVYDPYWSVQPIVIVAAFGLTHGFTLYTALLFAAIAFWGIRLTANWAYTFKNLTSQDWRYTMLRDTTKKWYPIINFIGIHSVPTLVVYAATLPAVYAVRERISGTPLAYLLLLICLFATLLQGVSDIEMHVYKKERKTPFIRIGLWRYARHPNYLGEILMWWGIALSVVFASGVYPLTLGAILNTVLFFSVSIPMAEKRQGRKAGFDEYKRETRLLLPLPKRK